METPEPTPEPQHKRAPNIQDVATALGMHKSTVSLGLSGKGNVSQKTRERIEAKAREMGYEPNPLARRLATSAADDLVFLCAGTLDLGLATDKILIIQKKLAELGLEAPVYTMPASEERGENSERVQAAQMRHLCRQGPTAIVCSNLGMGPAVYSELEAFQAGGGIVVCYDLQAPLQCDQVVFDRAQNAYQTARYLLERGHRDIGLAMSVLRGESVPLARSSHARVQGFVRALEEAGITPRPEWFFAETTYEQGGARLAAEFLALEHRPTAMCVVNDYMALAFMTEIMRAGVRVPDDLSIIGHDNQPIAVYCPVPLTSATQPKVEITSRVVELVSERMSAAARNEPRREARTVWVRGEIVERQSVAPPRFSML